MGFTAGIQRRRNQWAERTQQKAAERESSRLFELGSLCESLRSDWLEVASLSCEADAATEEVSNYVKSSKTSEREADREAASKALSSMVAPLCGSEGYSSIRKGLDRMGSVIETIAKESRQDVDSKELLERARGLSRALSVMRDTIEHKSRLESRWFGSFKSNMQSSLDGSASGISGSEEKQSPLLELNGFSTRVETKGSPSPTGGWTAGALVNSNSGLSLRQQKGREGPSHKFTFVGKGVIPGVIPSRQLAVEVSLDLTHLPWNTRSYEIPVRWNWVTSESGGLSLVLDPELDPYPLLELAKWNDTAQQLAHPSFVAVYSPLTTADTLSCKPFAYTSLTKWLWKNNRIRVNFKRDNTV